jgi:hypothetical protein
VKRFFLTIFSLSYFFVIYIVKEAMESLKETQQSPSLEISWQQLVGAFMLMGAALLLGYIGLLLCSYFEPKTLDIKTIESIEAANDNFLVNYIGFFLIATDMEDCVTLTLVFLFLLYLVFMSNVSYFNPAFLIFGYKFYIITTDLKTRIILITKQTVKKPEDILPFSHDEESRTTVQVRKINEYVFIQWKDK